MLKLVRKFLSLFAPKPEHHHSYRWVGLTDECKHGCTIIQCPCGDRQVAHSRAYNCSMQPHPDYSVPRKLSRNGCQSMDVYEI